jgi:hypothetical protein
MYLRLGDNDKGSDIYNSLYDYLRISSNKNKIQYIVGFMFEYEYD